jgi:hypothetical protein
MDKKRQENLTHRVKSFQREKIFNFAGSTLDAEVGQIWKLIDKY